MPSYNFIYLALSPGAKANKVKLTPDVREAISLGARPQVCPRISPSAPKAS